MAMTLALSQKNLLTGEKFMQSSLIYGPTAVETFSMTASSTAQSLTAANLLNTASEKAIWAEITAIDYAILYAFGTDPVSSSFGHILGADQTMTLSSPGDIRSFKFASKIAGSNATVVITPKF